MSENFIRLYAAGGAVDSAFFLGEGSVYFYASNVDKYAITGKNLIIGSTEILMRHYNGADIARIETAAADVKSDIKKISVDKFIAGLSGYSFALNTVLVLAKQVNLTGQILRKNMSDLDGEEEKIRAFAIDYYAIVDRVRQEYEKRRLPWLKEFVEEFRDSLTYKKGEAYCKSIEPGHIAGSADLSDKDIEYQRGSIICEENSPGSEMYILKSGSIDVIVRGRRISTIDEPGSVIGESSLLLNEKRNATLQAKNRVIMTRIRKDELKEIAETQKGFFPALAASLAQRHYLNLTRLENVNRSLMERAIDREVSGGDNKAALSRHAQKELSALKNRLDDIVAEKHTDFLRGITDNL